MSADVERIRRLIDGLRRDRRVHPYHGRREYSALAREVAAECEALLAREPEAAPALARRAVDLVTTALMYMDDSSGIVGDDLRAIMSVHACACTMAPPEPERLAAWLAKLRLDGPGWPDFELRDYAAALGEQGRAELARIVDERANVAAPDSRDQREPFGVRVLREQLAEISGDLDHYIAVLASDLRGPWRYLKIVTGLRDAGRSTEAEEWALTGLEQTANPIDLDKLRAAYVDLLLDRGAHDDALALRRAVFDRTPTHTHYRQLRETASRIGRWPGLRAQAIGGARAASDANPANVDVLIRILLDEDEPDEAWQVAVEHAEAVGQQLWHELIDLRQPTHPGDVIGPWRTLIEQRLNAGNDKYRYKRAVTMLRRLRDAYRGAGDSDGFQSYLAELRDRHRRKSSFLSTLDHAKL